MRLSRRRTRKSNISRGNRANVIYVHHAMSSLPGRTPVNTAGYDLSVVQCRRSKAESHARIIPPPPTEPGEHPANSHAGDRSRCWGSQNVLDQGQQQRISHSALSTSHVHRDPYLSRFPGSGSDACTQAPHGITARVEGVKLTESQERRLMEVAHRIKSAQRHFTSHSPGPTAGWDGWPKGFGTLLPRMRTCPPGSVAVSVNFVTSRFASAGVSRPSHRQLAT